MAENLLRLFDAPLCIPGQELKVSISIGVSLYPADAVDADNLRIKSDQALFYAKRNGRNRFAIASEEVCASFNDALAAERAVRNALRDDGFELHYQPIYDREGVASRFEALLRMKPSCPEVLPPAMFIPIAEESGLILAIGSWVIRQVCAQLVAWRDVADTRVCVAINVSARQLAQKEFAARILEILREHDLSPSYIEFELTETALMSEPELIKDSMAKLASAGIQFAIDDFGTGYSSLARLADLPIATLKIDRSFVVQLNRTNRRNGIVTSIIQMAETMGVSVVAEGVEDEIQLSLLRGRGCDYFQGYYLSKPMQVETLTNAFEEQSQLSLRHPNFDAQDTSRSHCGREPLLINPE
jgi:EAL domain-containing protein (putative c-di-GMP-specific phosphodiesterase class I)